MWAQRSLTLRQAKRGFHLITDRILESLPELPSLRVGWLNVFIRHTSASLTINENADPDVRTDFEMAINHVVPESLDYRHSDEGRDDMPAHVKASLFGPSLLIPVSDGRLALGTWQGIYLCEHRSMATPRQLLLTLQGE